MKVLILIRLIFEGYKEGASVLPLSTTPKIVLIKNLNSIIMNNVIQNKAVQKERRASRLRFLSKGPGSYQIESKQIESKQIESRQMESKQMESKQIESRQIESRQIESKQKSPQWVYL